MLLLQRHAAIRAELLAVVLCAAIRAERRRASLRLGLGLRLRCGVLRLRLGLRLGCGVLRLGLLRRRILGLLVRLLLIAALRGLLIRLLLIAALRSAAVGVVLIGVILVRIVLIGVGRLVGLIGSRLDGDALIRCAAEGEDGDEDIGQEDQSRRKTAALAERLSQSDLGLDAQNDVVDGDQHQQEAPAAAPCDLKHHIQVVEGDDGRPAGLVGLPEDDPHTHQHEHAQHQ